MGDSIKAIEDYTDCINLFDVSEPLWSLVRLKRSRAHAKQDNIIEALHDCTAIVELPGAPVEKIAEALSERVSLKGRSDDLEGEISDYTKVIELIDAPVEKVIEALIDRGLAKGRGGDRQGEIEDYTRVCAVPGIAVNLPSCSALAVCWK
jgi:hypothetical protein